MTQKRALLLQAMLLHGSVKKAADVCGINLHTAYKYANEPEFKKEYQAKLREAIDEALSYLKTRILAASEKAYSLMNNRKCSHRTQLEAARLLLEYATKAIETTEILQRLEALEAKTLEKS